MATYTIHEAKTNLSRLIARAEAGEEIVLARGRDPVARLVPLRTAQIARKFGVLRGRIAVGPAFDEPLPEDELARWE